MVGAIVIVVAGGLVAFTGVLGWLGRLPRNRLVGVRTAATMRSDEAFAVANRVAGPATAAGGVAAVAAGVLALVLPARDAAGSVLVGVAAMLVLVVAGAVQGVRAAGRSGG